MSHTSWIWVLYKFLTDPAMGPYARIKHKASITPFRKGNNMLWPYIDGVSSNSSMIRSTQFINVYLGITSLWIPQSQVQTVVVSVRNEAAIAETGINERMGPNCTAPLHSLDIFEFFMLCMYVHLQSDLPTPVLRPPSHKVDDVFELCRYVCTLALSFLFCEAFMS